MDILGHLSKSEKQEIGRLISKVVELYFQVDDKTPHTKPLNDNEVSESASEEKAPFSEEIERRNASSEITSAASNMFNELHDSIRKHKNSYQNIRESIKYLNRDLEPPKIRLEPPSIQDMIPPLIEPKFKSLNENYSKSEEEYPKTGIVDEESKSKPGKEDQQQDTKDTPNLGKKNTEKTPVKQSKGNTPLSETEIKSLIKNYIHPKREYPTANKETVETRLGTKTWAAMDSYSRSHYKKGLLDWRNELKSEFNEKTKYNFQNKKAPLTHEIILYHASLHYKEHEKLPPVSSNDPIETMDDGTTWNAVNVALYTGNRALPGNDSLMKLMKRNLDDIKNGKFLAAASSHAKTAPAQKKILSQV